MSSILFTIGLIKNVVKNNEITTGELLFRLNEVEFETLDFKLFNSSVHSFEEIVKGCMYSFVGSFFFEDKIKVSFLLQMIN
jgi:hypothetical protein